MQCNIGKKDRKARIIFGTLIILTGLYLNTWFGAFGGVLIFTALIGWCPVYKVFGMSTHKD
jgi:type IV secretory pathway TrbD component